MPSSSIASDDEWEKEDPNLLNNSELLFRECAKLPPPKNNSEGDAEFWEAVKITRELILDHNFILDALSKREEFRGSKESAQSVIENLLRTFETDCYKSLETLQRYQSLPVWDDAVKKKIFSSRSSERVNRWKATLNSFLEGYLKIRNYIPKEEIEDGQLSDAEKQGCKNVQIIIEELEEFLASLG